MLKNMVKFSWLCFSFLVLTISVFAEHPEESAVKADIIEAAFEAKISIDDYVPVGKSILLDASDSSLLNEE